MGRGAGWHRRQWRVPWKLLSARPGAPGPPGQAQGAGGPGLCSPTHPAPSRSWAVCGPAPALCPASEACPVVPQVQAPSVAFTRCTWSVGPTYSSGCLRGQGSQTPPLSSLNLGPVQGCPSQAVCLRPFHMSPRGLWSDQACLWALLSAPSGWALGAGCCPGSHGIVGCT